MGLDAVDICSAILTSEAIFFWLAFSFPVQQIPSDKVSTLKEKNLLPRGANSFLLE